jgi:hypothetical protein
MLLVRYKYSYDGERGEIICHIEVSSYQHTTKHNTKEFKVVDFEPIFCILDRLQTNLVLLKTC